MPLCEYVYVHVHVDGVVVTAMLYMCVDMASDDTGLSGEAITGMIAISVIVFIGQVLLFKWLNDKRKEGEISMPSISLPRISLLWKRRRTHHVAGTPELQMEVTTVRI